MNLVADQTERLDRFLARLLPEHSRTKLVKMIDAGSVLVDGKVQRSSFTLEAGMAVELDEPQPAPAHDLTPASIPLDIVFEDDSILVVNKPRGLASHPALTLKEPSLVNALLGRGAELSSVAGDFRPGIVHRLDKETTGLMVVAKTDEAHVHLAKQMETKEAARRYVAVVGGHVDQDLFSVNAPIGRNKQNRLLMAVDNNGKRAVTHVKKLRILEQGTLLALKLETGRTHQIRVHLSSFGMPVLGDTLYAPKGAASGVLQLHAAFLALTHPVTEEDISFYCDPPADFYGAPFVTRASVDPF